MSDDEEEAPSKSVVDKIKKQLPFLSKLIPTKKKATNPDATDPGVAIQDDDDEKPKKKKGLDKRILYAVVGIGLLVVFSDEFMPTEEPIAPPPIVKRPRPVPLNKPAETPPTDTAAPETEAASVDPAPTTEAVEPIAPVEEAPAIVETPVEAPIETPAVVTPIQEEPVATTTDPGPITVAPESDGAVISESPTIPAPDMPNNSVTNSEDDDSDMGLSADNASEDQIGMPGETSAQGGDLTDKILLDLEKQAEEKDKISPKQREYVTPPDYEYVGRGLVYNCVGKHWACVDAPSYKTCEQNFEGNKALNKKAECYPFNVYDKPKTCTSSQLMMTSSNAKTGFCNE